VIIQAARDVVSDEEKQEVLDWLLTDDFFKVCELASVDPKFVAEKISLFEELSKHISMRPELKREYNEFKNAIEINIQMNST
jgi:hypothetical protein